MVDQRGPGPRIEPEYICHKPTNTCRSLTKCGTTTLTLLEKKYHSGYRTCQRAYSHLSLSGFELTLPQNVACGS